MVSGRWNWVFLYVFINHHFPMWGEKLFFHLSPGRMSVSPAVSSTIHMLFLLCLDYFTPDVLLVTCPLSCHCYYYYHYNWGFTSPNGFCFSPKEILACHSMPRLNCFPQTLQSFNISSVNDSCNINVFQIWDIAWHLRPQLSPLLCWSWGTIFLLLSQRNPRRVQVSGADWNQSKLLFLSESWTVDTDSWP